MQTPVASLFSRPPPLWHYFYIFRSKLRFAVILGVELRWFDDGCEIAAIIDAAKLTPQIATQSQMGLLRESAWKSCIAKLSRG